MRSSVEYRLQIPEPKELYAPYITELGIAGPDRERSLTLRLWGATLAGVALGAAVGSLIGFGISADPFIAPTLNSERIAFMGKVAGGFGLFGGVTAAGIYASER